MAKHFIDKNVYEAAVERIGYLFNEFENVLVAFSGGKDSGVTLEICYDYAKEHGCLEKLAVYFLDYEAQFSSTVDYINETFERLDGIRRYWLCLPVSANFAPVAGESWYPWDPAEKENWLRELPDSEYLVDAEAAQKMGFKYTNRQSAGTVRKNFGKWYAKQYGTTAVIVGLRTDESLNRWRAIANRKHIYDGKRWVSSLEQNTATAYPIYDWSLDDVWHFYAAEQKPYSPMYDVCYLAGMNPNDIREVYPFCFYGTNSIKIYKTIEPDTWNSIVKRCPAANFVAMYGDTEAMGYKQIKLPPGHTWKTYFEYLMTTLPDNQQEHFSKMMERRTQKCSGEELSVMYKTMCVCVLRNDWKGYNASSSIAKKKVADRKAKAEKWRNLL